MESNGIKQNSNGLLLFSLTELNDELLKYRRENNIFCGEN